MDRGEFLTPDELRQFGATLTAQAKALDDQGIPHRRVGRRLLVSRHHIRQWLEGRALPSRRPNLAAAT